MTTEHLPAAPPLSLAARRDALIAQCDLQRMNAGNELGELLAPFQRGGGPFGGLGNIGVKLPLTIAGVVLGLIVTRAGRAMPLVSTGLSLWRIARSVLGLLRPAPHP